MSRLKSSTAPSDPQRRSVLRQGGLLLVAVGTAAMVPTQADAALLSKASVQYQDRPHGGQHCSDCAYFIPGTDAKANGSCRLVAGSIDPNGWCERFAS